MITKRHQIEIDTIILLLVAAGIGVAFAFYAGHKPQLPNRMYLPVVGNIQNPSPTPTLTPTPLPLPKPQITSQISPDGTKQVTMTVTTNRDLTKMYTFVTSNADGSNQQTIYTTAATTDLMSIPFNTWSPNDKYVFLTHTTAAGTEALAMRADGQPLTDTDSHINVTTVFNAQNTGNAYQETIGWASDTLLIVNTKAPDGTKGPSYWVEIPSKTVIRLASQF